MKLSEYIAALQEMLNEAGDDILMFTADDEEGNYFTQAGFLPEFRLIRDDEENKHRPEYLILPRDVNEDLDDWLDENNLDEDDLPKLRRVILL